MSKKSLDSCLNPDQERLFQNPVPKAKTVQDPTGHLPLPLPELSGEEGRHVALQPVVHDDGEVAGDHAVLVEGLHGVAAAVLQGDVVYLQVLEGSLAVDVGVV